MKLMRVCLICVIIAMPFSVYAGNKVVAAVNGVGITERQEKK